MILRLLLIFVTSYHCAWAADGYELRRLYRSFRTTAMGNAYLATVTDEDAIFLNPAGLAGVDSLQLHYLPSDTEISTDLVGEALKGTSALSGFNASTVNSLLMGKNHYGREQIAPSLISKNMGIAFLLDGQAAIRARNQALPNILVGYQTTMGVQGGIGFSLLKPGRGRKTNLGDLRVGISAKMMYRRGTYRYLSMNELLNIGMDTLHAIAGNYQVGYGLDFGTQYIRRFGKNLVLSAGLAFTDVGDTYFGGSVAPVRNNLGFGFAATYYTARQVKLTFAYDYQNILDNTDWRKRNHVGLAIGLPLFDLYGGINQTYLTYGASFDIFVFKLSALSYAEEQGAFSFQDGERRWALRLDLKLGL